MAKRLTHAACFAFFGTKPKNPRWSWSERSEDGQIVAVTLWSDRFLDGGRAYKNFESDVPGEWKSRPGFVELIDNLKHAADNLDGILSVIIATPKDPKARPRSIAECYPKKEFKMRVTSLEADDGRFTLERV